MTQKIIDNIRKSRSILEGSGDTLECMLTGHFPYGKDKFDETLYGRSYSEFLHICNGLWAGDIVLYGTDSIDGSQLLASEVGISKSRWLCIGHVEDGCLMLELSTENVYYFYEGYFYKGAGYDDAYRLLGDMAFFLTNYVFGKMYATLCISPEDDKWYIKFHPGDNVYYFNKKKLGSTGPEYSIQKISFRDFQKYTKDKTLLEKLLVMPMVRVSEAEKASFSELVYSVIREISYVSSDIDGICQCIADNCTEKKEHLP